MEIDDILALAKLGWRLHPLQKTSKVPCLNAWQNRATTDETTLRLWFSQYPEANWGVATGQESGIFVVDLDPKSGGEESWQELTKENNTPKTTEVLTGSGGRHLYFKWPDDAHIRNSTGKIAKGIDIRADGGQVVIPESVHPNGAVYAWINHPTKVAPAKAPRWLLDLIMEESDSDYNPLGSTLHRGNRNNSLYHAALALARQGAQREFILSTLKHWLKDQGQTDITDDELIKTIDSAIKSALSKPIEVSDKSDMANAELLIHTYGDDLIYVSGLGWFYWTGKVWELDVDDVIVTQLFVKCMKTLQEEATARMAASKSKADIKEAATIAAWAIRSLSSSAIKSAVQLASTVEGVRKNPDEIDSKNTLWLLNCANGTLNLKTGELLPHNKSNLITKIVNTNYIPNAKAPFWEHTLDLIFEGNTDLIKYIQRALGYSITGSQDERCFFICWGESGANGKSTILETIQDILGAGYAQMSDILVVTSSTTDNRVSSSLAKLQGARFVSMNEAEENQKLSEALIKQLTGGDTIQACYKYKNPFEYQPVFKLWIRTNERPIIRTQTNALWDRVKLIPFEKPIPKELRLPRSEVDAKLAEEREGILAWLVKGAQLWLAEGGLQDPPEVTAAVQGYRVDSDLVKMFIDECTVLSTNDRTKASDLYQAFQMWARESGERWIMTKNKFTRRLSAYGIETERSNGQTWFLGIRLTQQAAVYIM